MSDEKLEQAALAILRMTHEGRLEWEQKRPPESWTLATDSVYPLYFETWLNGRKLALFSRRDRSTATHKRLADIFDEPASDWMERYHLALLGDNDEVMFEFPVVSVVQDLFVAVQYKAANIDDFLDELIKSAPAEVKE